MKKYIEISWKYLKAHKKRTKLTILSIIAAVTLVVTIFSMLDSLLLFERTRVLKSEGNYHMLIRNASAQEKQTVTGRKDVQNAGSLQYYGEGMMNGEPCAFASIDGCIAANLNFNLTEGKYPADANEVMVEKWVMKAFGKKFVLGSQVDLTLPDGRKGQFIIAGVYKDIGATKATGIAGVFLSQKAAAGLATKTNDFYIRFRNNVKIQRSMDEIVRTLDIPAERVAQNERLLTLTLQSKNSRVLGIYALGSVLFLLVLTTALVMIYNTFNISIIERIRYFGIIRCIGASKRQIRRIVRREALILATIAIAIGEAIGFLLTTFCTGFLKIFNGTFYAELPLIHPSLPGMLGGVFLGYLAVYLAVKSPAKKASKTAPVLALSGADSAGTKKKKKIGHLTALFRIEIATGIQNAVRRKKTFALMSCSIGLSIIIFMGFSVLVNPQYLGMSPVKAYTPDISIQKEDGIDKALMKRLSCDNSVKSVYGRKTGCFGVSFAYERLTPWYRANADVIQIKEGLFTANEKAFVVSYDAVQLKWAKSYLSTGITDQDKLNAGHGIIAIEKNWRRSSYYETNRLKIGDQVHLKTPGGEEVFTVMGVCDTMPYSSQTMTLCSFILTEDLFDEISGGQKYTSVDIKLKNKSDDDAVNQIKVLAEPYGRFLDRRQLNNQARSAFLTMAAFIYGFAGIVALISIFNLFNTVNTGVISRTRYYGILRAIGITGKQLTLIVFTEAMVYGLGGALTGFVFGTLFQKVITDFLQGNWKIPMVQYLLIMVFIIVISGLAIKLPLKKIRGSQISEVITVIR